LVQAGTPRDILGAPANEFVSEFVGGRARVSLGVGAGGQNQNGLCLSNGEQTRKPLHFLRIKRVQAPGVDDDLRRTVDLRQHGLQRRRVLRLMQGQGEDVEKGLQLLDAAYPSRTAIKLILDNHSAHISKETRGYLQTMHQRFVFVFTPKHGSWLNLIENQFSKMTRTMLRGIRVASKQELIDRIHLYFEEIDAAPVVFRWKYKMDEIMIV